MNLTIEIPGLELLAGAIDRLATVYAGAPPVAAPEPKTTRSSPKVKEEAPPVADETIDAGTGRAEAQEPPVQLTVDHVKTMAVKLVASEGGKDKMKAILAGFGVAKFSEVPNDKLAEFAQKMVDAGVPLPTA